MNGRQIFHLGEILAANACVEGMKAQNAVAAVLGIGPQYHGDEFRKEADFIQMHARDAASEG
jgi:hypothetical protein